MNHTDEDYQDCQDHTLDEDEIQDKMYSTFGDEDGEGWVYEVKSGRNVHRVAAMSKSDALESFCKAFSGVRFDENDGVLIKRIERINIAVY